MRAVHFGAGKIGRGFIGYLLAKSGCDLTFVDISEKLVDSIRRLGRYQVVTLGTEKREETVGPVGAVALNDRPALTAAVRDADLITLSIGANNLKSTGKVLQQALRERCRTNPERSLDVIACENALFATDILKESVCEGAEPEFRAYLDKKVGFPNCAVDRIVPAAAAKGESPINVAVEDFYEWDIERGKIHINGSIRGARYVENLAPYLKRKIFLLNGAHALIAYTGYRKKYRYVHEAIRDPEIRAAVQKFHEEAIAALSREYGMDRGELEQYAQKLVRRFENAYLQDELTRVGRDPVRKLSGNDRLVAPLKLCERYGLECGGIVFAVAAGFAYDYGGDPRAVEIQKKISEQGIRKTVAQVTGLEETGPLAGRIAEQYAKLADKR